MQLSYKAFTSLIILLIVTLFTLFNNPQDFTLLKPGVTPTPKSVLGTSNTQLYVVTKIIDGDTIEVEGGSKIRLIGIDTPETVAPRKDVECFGKEASNKTKELLLNKQVLLEADATQSDVDRYGRYLRYVIVPDGTNINKYLIQEGFAHEYTYDNPYKYQSEFKAAENEARENKRGFWADDACP